MDKCPRCGSGSLKVIYAGLPGRICTREQACSTMWGMASWAAFLFFNGVLLVYSGSYWTALWHWLTESGHGAE